MIYDFKILIDASERILITSHTSPDPDAVASLLLLGTTLKLNFPGKDIRMHLEEEPTGLEFIPNYSQVSFGPIITELNEFSPQLFIIVDANSYSRVSRKDSRSIKSYIEEASISTAIIDHHEPDGKDSSDFYLNSSNIAAVQEVYELLFEKLLLQKPEGYAQTTIVGLYADSGGFVYSSPRHKQTLMLAADLVEAGVNIEDIKNKLNQFTDEQMKVISELTANISNGSSYTYTFLSDEFVDGWTGSDQTMASLHGATKPFVDNYIRNIGGRPWGFIVYKNPLEGEDMYSVSLRSLAGVMDVSLIARQMNGGGHKSASGADLNAKSVEEAIDLVKKAIPEARI